MSERCPRCARRFRNLLTSDPPSYDCLDPWHTQPPEPPCAECAEADAAEAQLGHASEDAYAGVMREIEQTRAEHPNHAEIPDEVERCARTHVDPDSQHLLDIIDRLQARAERYEKALRELGAIQPSTVEMFRNRGVVFRRAPMPQQNMDDEGETWEHIAFAIYTDLCEADSIARNALEGDNGS